MSWDLLDAAWRSAFEAMWEAYSAGTIPVGAALADENGTVVATGRNRIFDAAGPSGQLAGTRLAHAEVNALAGLGSERTYEGWTLSTVLEPCHLCVGACIAVRVGRVRFAGADPWGGAVGLTGPNPDTASHPLVFEGPLPGPCGLLPELLLAAHFLWRRPDGNVARFYREHRPERAAAAVGLLERGVVPRAPRLPPLVDVLDSLA